MKAGMRALAMAAVMVLAGCVNKAPKPDNPYYAPIQPVQMQHPQPATGSIYNAATSMDLYSDGRAHRVGDIITVVLTERTQSSKSASTTVDKSNNMSIGAPNLLGRDLTVLGNPLSASMNSDSAFDGEGSSDMSNSLNGNITVTVHQVLPNGALLVRGEKWLTLNQGDEYIRVSGLVRKQDIGPDNTVESTRLADARITYSGTGAPHDSNVMGWLARFFISPLWPF
ncbi:flagellar basal body L-ring protein FlgH [Marinobacterium sediminicola]|uniref:Flagellar L-ring protein n=1 Tax=Marinobacterium sediminicola TaxID=518898 RepID=A0ABY1RYG8_9GAMM|nr:flagellar basal body L-ring protein FlgH [Marinobacterium sediminicola]ULG68796.1 flagellar basal body L-ring protein FlgH [Marinobacterium sediminicola]SMR73326.1 flagellar L-ring protein precursor FlgH [Marinobacterium sediminicola]